MSTMTCPLFSYWLWHMKHSKWSQATETKQNKGWPHSKRWHDFLSWFAVETKKKHFPFMWDFFFSLSLNYYMQRPLGTYFLFLSLKSHMRRKPISSNNWSTGPLKWKNTPSGWHRSRAVWNLLSLHVQPEACNTDYSGWQAKIMHRLAAVREHWWKAGICCSLFKSHATSLSMHIFTSRHMEAITASKWRLLSWIDIVMAIGHC